MSVAEQMSHAELVKAYYLHQKNIANISVQNESLSSKNEILSAKIDSLEVNNDALAQKNKELKALNDWYRRQFFGQKSERLLHDTAVSAKQLSLSGEGYEPEESPPPQSTKVKEYERSHRKNEIEFAEPESQLKFDKHVPVEEVRVANPVTEGLSEEQYEVIGEEVCYKLAQSKGPYKVIKYIRPTVKVKSTGELSTAPVTAAASAIERSIAEVSFIAGLLLDKFQYHLPLYRQHQRLTASGIYLSRMTLTNIVHRAAQMLEPVYRALQSSILFSHTLALDETPIKAGRKVRGKMHQGYLWGMYGDNDELAFLYSSSRSGELLEKTLSKFVGTIVSDGYSVYERFAAQREDIIHAQCWVHTRRKFFEAQGSEPELCTKALELISKLYEIEAQCQRSERAPQATPVVDEFFSWLRAQFQSQALLPSSTFTKAAAYALDRESALRVFLKDDSVPLDTNHLERQIRPVAVGRKNWLFHWTEVGAEYAAIIQSLIASCKLQEIDTHTYFVDVLQRISSHGMRDVHLLTPRLWKENFASQPLCSDCPSSS